MAGRHTRMQKQHYYMHLLKKEKGKNEDGNKYV